MNGLYVDGEQPICVEESLGVDRIQHTTLGQGPIRRLLGYGDIDILSAGRSQETLNSIAGVRMFHAALTSSVEAPPNLHPEICICYDASERK